MFMDVCRVFCLMLVAVGTAVSGCGPGRPHRMGGPRLPRTEPAKAFTHLTGIQFVVLPVGSVEAAVGPGMSTELQMRRSVLIGAHEVTNAQYEAFVSAYQAKAAAADGEKEKAKFDKAILEHTRGKLSPGDRHPVNNVPARAAVAFCYWLTREDPFGRTYRLPDSVEWEYAARAGRSFAKYPWGNEITKDDACYGTEGPETVRSYKPNAYGLYDVAGNVAEWVVTNDFPRYELRGGAWCDGAEGVALSARGALPEPEGSLDHHGFRVLCEPPLIR
jgi:formylglycine-generating enzyme required for sulfatase activity